MSLALITGLTRRALVWVAALSLLGAVSVPGWSTEIYSSGEVPRAVGAATANSALTIDTNGRLMIGKVTCSFYIVHPYPQELQISLIGPDGTRVYFTHFVVNSTYTATGGNNTGGLASTGFGTGAAMTERVVIDDGANGHTLYRQATAAIPAGSYQGYNEDMADFCNKSADGIWTLVIEDGVTAINSGELMCWSLHIEPIVHHYWSGQGGNTKLSTPRNWVSGNPPLNGEGAAVLHFPAATGTTKLINDISRMTVAELDVDGGNYEWESPVGTDGYGNYPIAFADNAIVGIANGSLTVHARKVTIREHNRILAYNLNNRQPPGGYVSEDVQLSAHLRGVTNFNVADGAKLTFEGMVMDWTRRNDIGSTEILVPRLVGSVIKDLGGTLEFLCNQVADLRGWDYGSRYTGETVIKNGVLSIAQKTSLGRLIYYNNEGLQKVDTGTTVDGGTLELRTDLNVTDDRLQSYSEESLTLRGLGYKGTGALRVITSPVLAPVTATVTGTVALGYVTGAVVNAGDDVNPLDPNSVGVGALQNSTLNFKAENLSGDPLPVRIVGGTTTLDANGAVATLEAGGTVNWQTPVQSHFAVAERAVCNVNRAPLVPEKAVTPDLIPDESSLAIISGGRLNFLLSTYDNNNTTPGGTTDPITKKYRYCETVKSLVMGGGVLSAVDNGIIRVLDGQVTTYPTTSSQTGPSQILANLDLGQSPVFDVASNTTMAEHLILGYGDTDYQINSTPAPPFLCWVDLSAGFHANPDLITKAGDGTLVLAAHCAYQGDALINTGGLVVCNNMRNNVGGVVVGNVTLNDGFLAGHGDNAQVAAILVKKGDVAPGRPVNEGDFTYPLPTNMIAVKSLPVNPLPAGAPIGSGTLTCDSINFVGAETSFTVGLYASNGDCDKLRITSSANGYIALGTGGTSASLRPVWRSTGTADRAQWFVIMNNGQIQLPIGTFAGMPRLDPNIQPPWICYSFIPGGTATEDIQPNPLDLPFKNKMTNGYSVAIRCNGVVNFRPTNSADPLAKAAAIYTVPEVNVGDGSAVNLTLPIVADGPGKVSYQTTDGTAIAGMDYTPGQGQVVAPGNGPAVSIIYNQTIRPTRSFTVQLKAPTDGLALGRPTMATVTITDVNVVEESKSSGCGMSSGFAVFFLLIAGLGRLIVLRRRQD